MVNGLRGSPLLCPRLLESIRGGAPFAAPDPTLTPLPTRVRWKALVVLCGSSNGECGGIHGAWMRQYPVHPRATECAPTALLTPREQR